MLYFFSVDIHRHREVIKFLLVIIIDIMYFITHKFMYSLYTLFIIILRFLYFQVVWISDVWWMLVYSCHDRDSTLKHVTRQGASTNLAQI